MASVGTVVIEVDANIAKLVEGMKKSQNQLNRLERAATQAKDTIANFAKAAAGLYIVKQAIDLATGAVASFVNTAAQFEQFETTLTSITGSSEQAKKSMEWIQTFAAQTPFNIDKVTEAFVKMKAYGLDPQDGTLKALGNTAAAMGKDIVDAVEAMADAVTGENERLKEFGIKASQSGQKVAYSWADSSGKMRNISIANNKDIIQSTLTAIFNEKYVGAMEAQSKTWKGMMSNIEDSWTIFKKDVMNEGLFTYIKGMLGVMGDYLKNGFDGARNGAASMSESIITGIKSIILAVGNMYDVWNSLKLMFYGLGTAFLGIASFFIGHINIMAKAWDWMTVQMQNGFKRFVDDTGNMFYGLINWVLGAVSRLVNGINGAIGGVFDLVGIDNPFKPINLSIGQYVSSIKEAKVSTKDFIDNSGFSNAKAFLGALYDSIANEEGKNKALKVISDIDKKIKEMSKPQNSFEAQKKAAQEALDVLGAGYGALGDTAGKAGKKGADAAKAHEKALKDAAKAAEDLAAKQKEAYYDYLEATGQKAELAMAKAMDKYNENYSFLPNDKMRKEYFDGLVKNAKEAAGNMGKSFMKSIEEAAQNGNFAAILATKVMDSLSGIADALRSGDMNAVGDQVGNFIVSAANAIMPGLGAVIDLVGGLLSSTVTEAEKAAAKGRSDFSDASIKNLGDMFANVQYPMLEVTNKMYKNIRNMDNNFQSVARAITGKASASGIDLTGANFVDTMESGFLGFSSKNVSLIGTGLQFQLQNLTDMMDMASLSVKGYTSKLVQESSWWGLVNDTSISTTFTNLPDSVKKDIASTFANGYQAIMTAGVALGFNETSIADALAKAKLNIGKIDFTGLSSAEVSERFSMAVSEAFSGIINGIDMFSGIIDRYATSSEATLETWVRIATEYDQALHSFDLIGKNFIDSVGGFTKQMQVLDIVKSTGGLQNFGDAMSSFMSNFYTDAEQLKFMQESIGTAFQTLGLSTVPTTNSEFRKLLEGMDTSTESGAYLYGQILLLSDSFAQMTSASEQLQETSSAMIKNLSDAWLGNLSYLTLQQKAEYASGLLDIARTTNNITDRVEAARLKAEAGLKTTATKEEYIPIFNEYINELKNQNKEASLSDVVTRLDNLIAKVGELEETTRRKAG